MGNEASKRSEILYNINPQYSRDIYHGAIRIGDMKLIVGKPGVGPEFNDHYILPGTLVPGYLQMFNKSDPWPLFIYRERQTYLYDLKDDPNEYHNIAMDNINVVEEMLQRYEEYESTMIPPNLSPEIDEGSPIHFNGVWSSGWCKSEP